MGKRYVQVPNPIPVLLRQEPQTSFPVEGSAPRPGDPAPRHHYNFYAVGHVFWNVRKNDQVDIKRHGPVFFDQALKISVVTAAVRGDDDKYFHLGATQSNPRSFGVTLRS